MSSWVMLAASVFLVDVGASIMPFLPSWIVAIRLIFFQDQLSTGFELTGLEVMPFEVGFISLDCVSEGLRGLHIVDLMGAILIFSSIAKYQKVFFLNRTQLI